jgi:uncharacterized damage-inducible protein DinB
MYSVAYHFEQLALYNRWANQRLYADAGTLDDERRHRDVGVYFKSLFATLEHILKVDRAWQHLLGGGSVQDFPAAPTMTGFAALHDARRAQDDVLIERLRAVDGAWLNHPFSFASALPAWQGARYDGTRAGILTHLFNHQTHHRGQAHSALSLLSVEPSALDILVKGFLRE